MTMVALVVRGTMWELDRLSEEEMWLLLRTVVAVTQLAVSNVENVSKSCSQGSVQIL